MPINPSTPLPSSNEHERLAVTEIFVIDMLCLFGQPDDAANPKFVRQIAHKIMRALPVWAHHDSPLREGAQ